MTLQFNKTFAARRAVAPMALALCLAAGVVGCGNVTNVDAPDVVQPPALNNAAGADAYTNTALADFNNQLPLFAYNAALGSDEGYNTQSVTGDLNDQRAQIVGGFTGGPTGLGRVRLIASIAIELRRKYAPTPTSRLGQMFAVKGMSEMILGETMCNGYPLSDIKDIESLEPILGGPMSSDSMLKRALIDLDTATTMVADSARILNYVRLARGRTLLDLGRYAEAAAAVAAVPTSYFYRVEITTTTGGASNTFWSSNNGRSFTVSNREGVNGLDFITAGDPRVPTRANGKGTDLLTDVFLFTKYVDLTTPIVFSSGLEARLIEAEAALAANPNDATTTGTGWLGILNSLRTTEISPSLPPLADPGNPTARVNLLFRERAFWMYGTGHRFGDLRRLEKRYGRAHNTIWPTGLYKAGNSYGNDPAFAFGSSELTNPNVTSCTDMKA